MTFLATLLAPVVQCAMCAEALTSGQEKTTDLARGIFWSILLLLGVIFSLAGGIVFAVVRSSRSDRPMPPVPGAP